MTTWIKVTPAGSATVVSTVPVKLIGLLKIGLFHLSHARKIVLSSRHMLWSIPKSMLATPEDQQTRTKQLSMQMTWALSDSEIIDQASVLVQYLISDLDIEQVHLDMLQYKLPCGSGSLIYALVALSTNSICRVCGLMRFQAYEHGCLCGS